MKRSSDHTRTIVNLNCIVKCDYGFYYTYISLSIRTGLRGKMCEMSYLKFYRLLRNWLEARHSQLFPMDGPSNHRCGMSDFIVVLWTAQQIKPCKEDQQGAKCKTLTVSDE